MFVYVSMFVKITNESALSKETIYAIDINEYGNLAKIMSNPLRKMNRHKNSSSCV